jgi:NAD(P)-dependent dehydrogenase (short-subunit alcohol dehydrogenase family)
MSQSLKGRIAVVTGGSRGIGRAVAESLLRDGAAVAICGRSKKDVDQAVSEMSNLGRVTGHVADVANAEAVTKFFEFVDNTLGAPDVLVNNAGIGIFRPVGDLSVEEWRQVLGINLDGVYYCCHAVLPRMRSKGGGSIINISSLAGRNPFAGGAAYNASKFGLNGFSEAMMLDHRNEGIRVTYIMPGSVDTHFSPRSGRAEWKIAPQDIADVVMAVLRMPARTTVSRVEIRPSIPPK